MRFLADESCDFAVVRALRAAGHDVSTVPDVAPGAEDHIVAALAGSRGSQVRVLPGARPAPRVIARRPSLRFAATRSARGERHRVLPGAPLCCFPTSDCPNEPCDFSRRWCRPLESRAVGALFRARLTNDGQSAAPRYWPTAFSWRRRSHTPVIAFRSSSSLMFRYRCVCLMSACPSINWIVRMSYAVGQEPARALVTQIVPVQVDLPQLLSIDATALLRANDLVTVRP